MLKVPLFESALEVKALPVDWRYEYIHHRLHGFHCYLIPVGFKEQWARRCQQLLPLALAWLTNEGLPQNARVYEQPGGADVRTCSSLMSLLTISASLVLSTNNPGNSLRVSCEIEFKIDSHSFSFLDIQRVMHTLLESAESILELSVRRITARKIELTRLRLSVVSY